MIHFFDSEDEGEGKVPGVLADDAEDAEEGADDEEGEDEDETVD